MREVKSHVSIQVLIYNSLNAGTFITAFLIFLSRLAATELQLRNAKQLHSDNYELKWRGGRRSGWKKIQDMLSVGAVIIIINILYKAQ